MKKILFSLLIIIAAAFVSYRDTGVSAYADAIDDVPLAYEINSKGDHVSAEDGVEYKITAVKNTIKLSYTFVYTYDREDTVGLLDFTYNEASGFNEATIKFYENGYFSVTAEIQKTATEKVTETSVNYDVKKIDYAAPVFDKSKESYEYTLNAGRTTLKYYMCAYDDQKLQKQTDASGIKRIMIFFLNQNLSVDDVKDKTADELKASGLIGSVYEKDFSDYRKAQQSHYFDFTATEDGLYCAYLEDNVGNAWIDFLFPLTLSVATEDYSLEIDGSIIKCGEVINTAFSQVENGKGKYKESILTTLDRAARELLYAFQTEKEDSEKVALWETLRSAQVSYNNAVVTLKTEIVNEDLLPAPLTLGKISALNVTALKGDEVVVRVIVSVYTEKLDERVTTLTDLKAKRILKLQFSVLLNGTEVPINKPVTAYLELPENYGATELVSEKEGGFSILDGAESSARWVSFSFEASPVTVYIVSDKSGKNLLWLYITAPIAFVILSAGITVLVIYIVRRKKLNNNGIDRGNGLEKDSEESVPHDNRENSEEK